MKENMQLINSAINAQLLAEKSRQEYAATLYASAALAYITMISTTDALDDLKRDCTSLIRQKVRYSVNQIEKCHQKLRGAIEAQMKGRDDVSWMFDVSNVAYGKIEPHCEKFHVAIANFLGKYPKVLYRHTFASIIIAQSLAGEATRYVNRASKKFANYNVTGKDGKLQSAQAVIQSLSCAAIHHYLTIMADALMNPCLPKDLDILSNQDVYNGCKAIINILLDPKTWEEARVKSDTFNNRKS